MPQELRSNMVSVKSPVSSLTNHPTNYVSVPSGYSLIGGGARVNWTGAGNLLVYSYPSSNFWNVGSKDHNVASPATIEAWAIGINNYIPNFGYIDIIGTSLYCNFGTTGSGNFQLGCGWEVGYAPVCVGVRNQYNNSSGGRLVTGLRPPSFLFPGNAASQSKDLNVPTSGSMALYLTQIRKRP